jgi:hypothetical protein
MARRRRTKLRDLTTLVIAGAVVYAIWREALPLVVWILLATAVVFGWITLAMPTYCDVETIRGGPCRRGVYGKLHACRTHARDKRDALFAYVNLKNPGLLFRRIWPATEYESASGGQVVTSPSHVKRAKETERRTAYDVAMLLVAVISAVAGIVGAVGAILALH